MVYFIFSYVKHVACNVFQEHNNIYIYWKDKLNFGMKHNSKYAKQKHLPKEYF